MSSEPSRDPNANPEESWTNILELTLQGWDVTDVLTIFENNDTFIKDWHNSLGDTCGPLPALSTLSPSIMILCDNSVLQLPLYVCSPFSMEIRLKPSACGSWKKK